MTTHTTLRITRRGRVVLAALIALPVLVVSLFLATPGAVAESTGTQDTYEYVTVLAGIPCGRLRKALPLRATLVM